MGSSSPPPPPPPPRQGSRSPYVARGDWDVVEGWIGLPRSGKSTAMMGKATEFAPRCYLIASDPNHNLPKQLPDGRIVPLRRHATIDSVRAAIASNPYGVHASDADPDALLELCIEIARRGMVKSGDKEIGVPVVFIVDETVAWEAAANPQHLAPNLKDFLARRRPYHVGLWFGTQFPTLAHRRLLTMATDLHLSRMVDKPDQKRMLDGGVPLSLVEQLSSLPPYKFLHYHR